MNACLTVSRSSRSLLLAWALAAAAFALHAEEPPASGGAWSSSDPGWSRWQGRVGLSNPLGAAGADGLAVQGADGFGPRNSLSLLGDYYFTQRGLSAEDRFGGGFRATGGLFVGPRSGLWLATPASVSALSAGIVTQRRGFGLLPATTPDAYDGNSVPYVGVGYTGLKSLRATGGGWGFSADVGLVALQPRSLVRLGQQSLGDSLRDTQLSPLLQLGVSYSF